MTISGPKGSVCHRLKTWPEFFDDVKSGRKRFEIRKSDRDFRVGDTWIADEYRPGYGITSRTAGPFRITYVTPESSCLPGLRGFAFEPAKRLPIEPDANPAGAPAGHPSPRADRADDPALEHHPSYYRRG